ncbi:hypothetical protein B0H19DRAFT_705938 [Mycena capillaripes]|nr:hypothetical protein B0H19DRAFT_705938 [Mycena capillaripes]
MSVAWLLAYPLRYPARAFAFIRSNDVLHHVNAVLTGSYLAGASRRLHVLGQGARWMITSCVSAITAVTHVIE